MALVNPKALRLGRRILKEEERVLFLKPKIVDVYTGEVLEGYNVLCSGPYVFQLTKRDVEADLRIHLEGAYLVPGFIEGHIHVESSMLIPSEFSKLAVSHGTTLVVADPHEVANVSGLEGVMAFMQNARETPLRFLFEAPSCVPATDPRLGLETPGRTLGKDEVSALLSLEYVIGLGEVMDFFSVLSGEARDKLEVALQREKVIEGHMPKMPEEMINLEKFLGISSCHESTDAKEGLEKIRRGIYLMVREGSAWRDLRALLPLFTELGIDVRRATFVSDDLSVVDLVEKGHMDRILREAISLGLDPIKAIQMATLSPAEHLGLSDLFGGISPGCLADFSILESLEEVRVIGTVLGGKIRYYKGKFFNWPRSSSSFPNFMLDSVHVKKIPSPEALEVEARGPYAEVRVIEAVPGSALTYERRRILEVEEGAVKASGSVRYVSVLERHHGTGNFSSGFVSGIPIRGALAQSIAHDSHHIIGVGDNLEDLALAIKAVCLLGGGIVYVKGGKVISKVPLEVSGLMSSRPWEEVYEKAKELAEKFGHGFESIHLTVSLLALPVIPELRITDKGVVRVEEGRRVPVVVREGILPEEREEILNVRGDPK